MKRCIVVFLLLVSLQAYSQKMVVFKRWQPALSAGIGYNYGGGYDLHFMAHARINTSNWGVYGGFAYGKERLSVDPGLDYKEKVVSRFPEIGASYSFYDRMIPLPLNLYPFVGIVYNFEKSNVENAPEISDKTFGNSFGVALDYYLTKNVAIMLKQHCYLLYNSNFGNFRTVTSAGVTVKF